MTISVNGTEISDEAVNRESANFEGGSIEARQRRAAEALAIRELLRQRAVELGLDRDDDEDSVIDALTREEAAVPTPDRAACQAYFDGNRERFTTPVLAEVRHILLSAHPEDFDARDRRRREAEALVEELTHGRGVFARLAAAHSDCPSRSEGGHLGAIERGATVPEFESAVLRMPVGLAERPLESRYGWHVVEVLQRTGGDPLPFEAVEPRIRDYLAERSRRRALSQYIRVLAAEADIEGVDLGAAESPLLQ
ncbi:MAG TPA: peptidylprolyl isomerase [Gammaproteobacteria bacterium]|nr:peptidylprolyl isomerase [Gammaproteobacteria bacterium]